MFGLRNVVAAAVIHPNLTVPRLLNFRMARRACHTVTLAACAAAAARVSAQDVGPPQYDHAGITVFVLTGEVLTAHPIIGRPTKVRRVGDQLIVRDFAGDPVIHVLSASDGRILYSFGRSGRGPAEVVAAMSHGSVPRDDQRFWVFDADLARVTVFDVSNVLDEEPDIIPLRGTAERAISRITWLGSDRMISIGPSPAQRFALFDTDGVRVAIRSGQLLGADSIAERERIRASYGLLSVCARPDGDVFALAYGSAGRVELYDAHAALIRSAHVPFSSEAPFEYDESAEAVVFRHTRTWYVDCAGTDSRLYALFSGRRSDAFRTGERDSGRFIHVFDWRGDLRGAMQLDRDVRGISLDPERRLLYAVSLLDGAVLRYRLPRELEAGG